MKKFLFTLAALFVAGSAFASSFLYMDKYDLVGKTGEQTLVVKAHFEEYVSAVDFTFTLPEGLTITDFEAGEDLPITYYNSAGRSKTTTPEPSTMDNVHFIIITGTVAGYYQLEDGTWSAYGVIKWEPGNYEEFMIIYVNVDENYAGGDVAISTKPSCGEDTRDITRAVIADGKQDVVWGWTPGEEPQPAPEPTFREADGKLYAECADHEVVLMDAEGNELPNPYTLPAATFEEQVLNFTAYTVANADESGNSEVVSYQVTIDAKADAKADAPKFRVEDGKLYAESEQGLDVVMMLDGVECENT